MLPQTGLPAILCYISNDVIPYLPPQTFPYIYYLHTCFSDNMHNRF